MYTAPPHPGTGHSLESIHMAAIDNTFEINHSGLHLCMRAARLNTSALATRSHVDRRSVERIVNPLSERKVAREKTVQMLAATLGCQASDIVYGYPDHPVVQDKRGELLPVRELKAVSREAVARALEPEPTKELDI